jgi:phage FluMu protein Com
VADAKLKNNSVLTKTESEPADFMIECPRCHKLFGLYIKMLHSA